MEKDEFQIKTKMTECGYQLKMIGSKMKALRVESNFLKVTDILTETEKLEILRQ